MKVEQMSLTFNSLPFLAFMPITAVVAFMLPPRAMRVWLLAMSLVFYLSWDIRFGAVLLGIILVSYFGARYLEGENRKKRDMALVAALLLAGLIFFKYTAFFLRNINMISMKAGRGEAIGIPDLIQPVGISYFTFEAVGYCVDVYKKRIRAERDFIKHALFLSFFPTVLSGPIERAEKLLPQFDRKLRFDAARIRDGFLLFLWGMFLKMVCSARIAVIVETILSQYAKYDGFYAIFATAMYLMQLYCDFCGYSCMASGTGEILGIGLTTNFREPFLGRTVAEYWRRWHISLTSWLRDYIYIPLGGSRKGKLRKYINILVVFLVSGLWHGSSWNFAVWGLLNGAYQVAGEALKPARDFLAAASGTDRNSFSHILAQRLVTFGLVSFSFVFFRAPSMMEGLRIAASFLHFNPWIFVDGSLYSLNLNPLEFWIMMISAALVLFVDGVNNRGISVRSFMASQGLWLRWGFYISAILTVLVFGKYGPGYDASSFIYFRF